MSEEPVVPTEEPEPTNALAEDQPEVPPQEGDQPEPPEAEPVKKKTESEDEFDAKRKAWQEKVDRRIARITAEKYQLKEQLERERAGKRELESLIAANEAKAKLNQEEPRRDSFDDDEAYLKALTQWNYKIGRAEERHQEAAAKYEKVKEVKPPEPAQTEHPLKEAFEEGKTKYNDFERVVLGNQTNPIFTNGDLASYTIDLLADSEVAHEVLYHLGKSHDESARLARLSPPAFAREIGKIEERLQHRPSKQTTKAPPPLKPVSGKDPVKTEVDPDKDPATWIRMRNEGKI